MNGPARLGLRENLAQFVLLVAVNALVGGMYGQERTVLPLLAESEFGLTHYTGVLTFILVIMKIDLVGPARRGMAMGLNEAAGYVAVAATALATGYIAARHGLRPEPFFLGIAYAALGLGLSTIVVRETRDFGRRRRSGL